VTDTAFDAVVIGTGFVGDAGKLADDALESTREKHEAGLEGSVWGVSTGGRGRTGRRVSISREGCRIVP
jgi:hypothetical protein